MRFADSVSIAIISLRARRTRSFLAAVGIVIGIAAVIIMVAIGKGSQQEALDIIHNMGENLITVNAGEMKRRGGKLVLAGAVTTLTFRDAQLLAEDIGLIEKVAPYESRELVIKFGNSPMRINVGGTTADFLDIRKYVIEEGVFFTPEDIKQSRRVAVIGKTAVNNIFGGEPPLGKTIRIKSIPFTVIGVFQSKGIDSQGADQDDILVIPFSTMLRRVLNQRYISTIYLQAASQEVMEQAVDKVRRLLRARHKLGEGREDDFTIQNQLNIEQLKMETAATFTALTSGVAAISLIVGGIGILAVMLISVKERTREIGIRRAVGATRRDIMRQFLLESVVLCGLGGMAGIGLGTGITLALAAWSPWTLILDQRSIVVSAAVCAAIGVGFGIYPALKASRLDPMEALRVE